MTSQALARIICWQQWFGTVLQQQPAHSIKWPYSHPEPGKDRLPTRNSRNIVGAAHLISVRVAVKPSRNRFSIAQTDRPYHASPQGKPYVGKPAMQIGVAASNACTGKARQGAKEHQVFSAGVAPSPLVFEHGRRAPGPGSPADRSYRLLRPSPRTPPDRPADIFRRYRHAGRSLYPRGGTAVAACSGVLPGWRRGSAGFPEQSPRGQMRHYIEPAMLTFKTASACVRWAGMAICNTRPFDR